MNPLDVLRCKWTSHRLGAYLDVDSGAVISQKDRERIAAHLSECEKCTKKLAEFSKIKGFLGAMGRNLSDDQARLEALKKKIDEMVEGFSD